MLFESLSLLLFPFIVCGQQCYVPGKCEEIPLEFTTTVDEYACLGFCQNDTMCAWFTWYDDNVCTTFLKCDTLNPDCGSGKTCVSGERTCNAGPQCGIIGDCQAVPIDNDLTNSERDCATNVCAANPACEWYSYDDSNGVCLIYDSCPTVDASCTTCVSGENECAEVGPLCDLVGLCQDVPIDNFSGSTFQDCADDCANNPSCEWFTFDSASSICFLYSDCNSLDESCALCLTGQDECGSGSQTTTTRSTTTTTIPVDTTYYPNVVVIGGYDDSSSETSDVETFSTDGSQTCSKPADLPYSAKELTAGLIGSEIIVAGGVAVGTHYSDVYLFTGGSWAAQTQMSSPRAYIASATTSNGFWVLGGYDGSNRLISSELFQGGTWSAGPDLPMAMYGMCAVQLDSSRTLIAGGNSDNEAYLNSTYIYDWTASQWTQVGDMIKSKSQHDCVLTSDGRVISAGGTGEFGPLGDAEAFDVGSGTWSALASLPSPVQSPAMSTTSTGNALVIGGLGDGFSSDVYEFDGSSWQLSPSWGLAQARYEHSAVSVPDATLSGC